MGIGPITVFDKSLLEALSLDECVWLGQFYRINVVPVFLIETLADLDKEVSKGRTPEQVVGRLAEKTNAISADPNVHHSFLCTSDLLGRRIEMRRFPVLGRAVPVMQGGRKGLRYAPTPESDALGRWHRGEFHEVERAYAKERREWLGKLDLETTYREFRAVVEGDWKPKSLGDAKSLSDRMLSDPQLSGRLLGFAVESLGIPVGARGAVLKRWRKAGRPVLPRFAPFAAHAVNVELFFSLAVGSDLISKERPSNKVDLAYLYYLPFTMVFTSMDRLHERTVPLFLQADQAFVWGGELKEDLRRLDEHFSALPEDVKNGGVSAFAHRPPDGDFLTTRLWDQFMGDWRKTETRPASSARASERDIVREVRAAARAKPLDAPISMEEAEFVLIERVVPVQVGKWRMLPPGVEKKQG